MDDGLRKTGAMPVALGKRVHILMQDGLEEAQLHRPLDRRLLRGTAQAADFRREIQEAVYRHVRVGRGVFWEITHEFLGGNRLVRNVEAAHGYRAAGGGKETGDHAHGGGFARAVRPEKTQHLAAFHRERNPIHRPFSAK